MGIRADYIMFFKIGLEEGPEGFAKPIREKDTDAAYGALYLARGKGAHVSTRSCRSQSGSAQIAVSGFSLFFSKSTHSKKRQHLIQDPFFLYVRYQQRKLGLLFSNPCGKGRAR